MKRTILATIGALSLLLFIGAPASAQDDDEDYDDAYSHNGAYAHFNAVAAVETFNSISPYVVDTGDAVSPGFSTKLGYRFAPHMSVEAEFIWVEEWNFQDGGHTAKKLQDSTSGLLNFKYYVLTDRFQPYGIIGAGVTRMRLKNVQTGKTDKDTEPSAQIGGGLDYYVTDSVGINMELVYHRQFEDLDNYSTVNGKFGIFLRF